MTPPKPVWRALLEPDWTAERSLREWVVLFKELERTYGPQAPFRLVLGFGEVCVTPMRKVRRKV